MMREKNREKEKEILKIEKKGKTTTTTNEITFKLFTFTRLDA